MACIFFFVAALQMPFIQKQGDTISPFIPKHSFAFLFMPEALLCVLRALLIMMTLLNVIIRIITELFCVRILHKVREG